ncbi:MAG: hypothetical protein R2729_28040 [Bryobacteraceae bacterium]
MSISIQASAVKIAELVTKQVGGQSPLGQLGLDSVQKGLQQLKQLVEGLTKGLTGGAPQAPAQPPAFSTSKIDPQVMANPQQVIVSININISGARQSNAPLKSFPLAPEAGGVPGSFGAQANVVSSRITGSNKSQYTYGANGPWGDANKDEKVAIAHAMFKNPNVQFDSDTKKFFVTGTDGSRRDVATLDELVAAGRKAGGFAPSNAAAITQIAGLLEGRISAPGATSSQPATQSAPAQSAQQSDPLAQIMDLLKKLLEALTGKAQAGGAQSAAGSQAAAETGASQAASASGSGGSSSAAPATSAGGKSEILSSESQWGNIDSMMAEAEKLAMSKNPSDQLKAQKLMQQAQQMFQTISKLLSQLSEMFKTAMGNIR